MARGHRFQKIGRKGEVRYGYAAAYSTVIFGILLLYSMVQNRMSRATEAA